MGKTREVLNPFSDEAKELMNGGIFEHYKKKRYKVIGVGRHTETLEEMVTYYDENKNLWIRPLKMFIERVTIDGETVPRFKRIN